MSNPRKKYQPAGSVVITGTLSFIGSNLLRALEADNHHYSSIIVIDKKKPAFNSKKTKYFKIDLTEPMADEQLSEILKKEKCDTLVHCAFPITPPKNQAFSHELISVGTFYLFNACAEAKVRKIIMASTTDVYGAFPSNPNFLEEDLHPAHGDRQSSFLKDKIDAEKQALRYAKKHPDRCVTILRPATILGPTVSSYKTRLMKRPFVATILGFDPLIQFVHEEDVITAFKMAVDKDVPGIFNIVGNGVLPLSRVIKIGGKIHLRFPQIGFKTFIQLLWYADISPAPASHVDFLRYLCVADGSKAKQKLGFVPKYSTKEALLSFIGAERLREINLLEV